MKCGLIGAAAILVLLAISLEHVHADYPYAITDGCRDEYFWDVAKTLCYKYSNTTPEDSGPGVANYADAVIACDNEGAVLPTTYGKYGGYIGDTWLITSDPDTGPCRLQTGRYGYDEGPCGIPMCFLCIIVDTPNEEDDELECSITGDPLVKTCDGAPILLVGQGEYTLAENLTPDDAACAFSIRVITAPASDPLFTMPEAVHIVFDTIDIRVDQTGTQVGATSSVDDHDTNWPNPLYEQPDVYTGGVVTVAGYTVDKYGDDIVFHSDHCNINVRFTHVGDNSELDVTLGSEYKNGIDGLCGNCNGDFKDDLVTSEGDDVTNDEHRNSLISDSWLIVYAMDQIPSSE